MFYIRELKEEDFLSGSGLEETLAALTKTYKLSSERAREIFSKLTRENASFFVAVSDRKEARKQIVGFVKILYDQKIFRCGALAAHIEDVAVRKGFSQKGIGADLIKTAVKASRKKGCYKITLDCESKTLAFYQKQGFDIYGVTMRMEL
jgi:glucosamine-phosphate N-acetyltransferase